MDSLHAALSHAPIVLDGGLGTRLESRGNDVTSALWSAEILRTDPTEVRQTHEDFFRAGARVATTASYQVSYDGYARVGLDAREVDALLQQSIQVARDARDNAGLSSTEAWVLASVGPYGASLGDGSEYTGAYGLSAAELQEWHVRRMQVLTSAAPDALLCETIPNLDEARGLSGAVRLVRDSMPQGAPHVPVIMSFTVGNGTLRSGESLSAAARVATATPGSIAVGVNCSTADDATSALHALRSATDLPLIVYPNSGEVWNAHTRSWSGIAKPLGSYVNEWLTLGASLIGGCCRVDTAELATIAECVRRERP